VVDCDRLLGQEHRVPVGVAGHEAADPHALGRLCHRSLQDPAFENRPVGTAVSNRRQVIEVPDVVEACFVSDAPDGTKRLDRSVLPRQL